MATTAAPRLAFLREITLDRIITAILFVSLAAFFFVVLVIPFGLLLSTAFRQMDLMTYQFQDGYSFHQFLRFFSDAYYLRILFDTVVLALETTFVTLVLAYPLALYMSRAGVRERQILRLLSVSPILISIVVMNFGWVIVMAPQGLVNNTLMGLGLIDEPLPLLYSHVVVVLGLVHVHLPFMILAIDNGLGSIQPEVLKAAESLGASRWKTLRNVIWPLSINGVVSGSIVVFALTASSFVTPMLLGGAWTKTLATVAYQQILFTLDSPFGAAICLILLSVTATFSIGLTRLAIRLQPHRAAPAAPAPRP
ncbi:ABC transporter permease [Acuticoccus mangrovi]|uniref:ABC transporter permease n=1 Tax=Acuticoccus mangrovi TaxID=2796142 RepID=A0A934MKP5_9HYPH|nr:ABC transporter permease [Acuticoccus mangrovi]MBJ3775649.1 ABC transporter permease [Acuticoccus mangrovi]